MITCPRTGRTWPDEKAIDLKTCVRCKAKIDVRHETWMGTQREPMHPGPCPPPEIAEPADAPTITPVKPAPPSGRELLERNDWYAKNVINKETP